MYTSQLQAQARDGNPEAQFQLAALHQKGVSVPQSAAKAREWYACAAENGNPKAVPGL